MTFIKTKAIFMIVLISLISLTVYTPGVKAQQQECCERTRDGSFCVYTDSLNCEGPNHAPAFCEDTSFCQLGCCFDSDSGECFSNTAQSECNQLGGSWDSSASCGEISQCQVGCCQLNNQAFLSTQTKCKQVVSQYSDTEPNFDPAIQDEFSCLNSVRSQEQGCCVTQNSCTFITRASCSQQETAPDIETGRAIGFHPGILCSFDSLGCNAAKQHKLSCYSEDVYWFDSEGNPENVFLGDSEQQKRSSYNNGRVLEDSGCEATPNDQDCGNCDYAQGTMCSDKDGEPKCISLDCAETTQFPNSPDSSSSKELGDSWCIFDGPVGFGQDRPGSRHFRAACINGEEVIEPCQDFREEFCTQAVSNGQNTNQFGSIYQALTSNLPTLIGSSPTSQIFSGSDYSEGACRENRFESCTQCNEFSTTEEVRLCCNEKAYRDCSFIQAGVTDKGGTCIPNVPPGAKFWSDSQSVLERQTTVTEEGQDQTVINNVPEVPADDVCKQANQECEVGFSKTTFSDWECTYNCECLKEESFIAAHSICRSISDCGASMNFIGKTTRTGFDIKVFGPKGKELGKIKQNKQVAQFIEKVRAGALDDALVKEPREGGRPKKYGFKDFFSDSAIPIGAILASGLLATGTAAGFFGGLFFGPQFALGTLSGLIGSVTGTSSAGGVGVAIFGPAAPVSQADTITKSGFGVYQRGIANGASLNNIAVTGARSSFGSGATLSSGSSITAAESIQLSIPAGVKTTVNGVSATQANAGAYTLKAGETLVVESGTVTTTGAGTGTLTTTSATSAKGFTSAANQLTGQVSPLATVWGIIQVIAWVWTIYNIIDFLGADTVTGKVQFVCKAWDPPSGGEDCELCNPQNEKGLVCSEYRCRSLGKACSIINEGTENELCVNTLPDDARSPRIAADKDNMDFEIQEEPNKGFTITEKIPPFTSVSLVIKTDEPAECKFSTEPGTEFEDKEFGFGSGLSDFNHKIDFTLPSELTDEQAIQLTNGGKYTIYLRCQDANGNANERDYIINFQIDDGPDLEPPRRLSTSILSGTTILSGIEAVSLDLFTNEPGSCKWSTRDLEFNLMENSFSCVASGFNLESSIIGNYRCSTSLPTQLTDSSTIDNNFYFRCRDNAGNINQDSFRYKLISTPELSITSTSPNGTLRTGSGITLGVTTQRGANNGVAACGFSTQDLSLSSIPQFQNTNSQTHSQTFQLLEQGDYNYLITCIDEAGNQVKSNIQFKVEADTIPPILFSVFKDIQLGILSITTNEPTSCRYSDEQFQFEQGIPMTNDNTIKHEASLESNLFIIKCQDEFKNEATFSIFP